MSDQTLERGMLLLEPGKEGRLGTVWTVAAVNKKSARLLMYSNGLIGDATLNGTTIPKGWRHVQNRALTAKLEAMLAEEDKD